MKRFRLWVRELSLLQQILCIIFMFVAVFVGFLFFFITPAIDRFSETEIFEQLHASQSPIIDYINEHPSEEEVAYGLDDIRWKQKQKSNQVKNTYIPLRF